MNVSYGLEVGRRGDKAFFQRLLLYFTKEGYQYSEDLKSVNMGVKMER
jgi:hypothetical protein